MKFLDHLDIRWLDPEAAEGRESATALLLSPMRFEVNGCVYVVPAGFITDHASIPRVLWSLYAPTDPPYRRAAVVHDYAYQHNGILRSANGGLGLILPDRWNVDVLFLQGMEADKARWTARHVLFRGVRLGGWVAWNRYRKAEKL